jgi:hypothetical protein
MDSAIKSPTASISPSLIPTFSGRPFAFKKVGIAVVLSDSIKEVELLYTAVTRRHPELFLSQSHDGPIRRLCQLAAIEIKSPDGSYYGSSVQLAIWLAAGLENVRRLRVQAATTDDSLGTTSARGDGSAEEPTQLLPYPGISVVGQAWYVHLATKGEAGTVVRTCLKHETILLRPFEYTIQSVED